MADGGFVAWITSAAPPAYALLLGCAVLAVRWFPAWKQRWTEARTADDAIVGHQWSRLTGEIKRLDERCARIEEREEECQQKLNEALHRIAELEGYDSGQGAARQEAQGIVSAERMLREDKKK